jgi:hypothetical protein
LVGPLQYSNNCNYIFTIIHSTSKWMKAIPLSQISAVASALTLFFSLFLVKKNFSFFLDNPLWGA